MAAPESRQAASAQAAEEVTLLFAAPGQVRGERINPRSPQDVQASAEGKLPHGRNAPVDAAGFVSLEGLRAGDRVRLPLLEGEVVEGVVNLTLLDLGVRRVAGRLDASRPGTFSLSARDGAAGGRIILTRERVVFEIARESDGRTVMVEKALRDVACDAIPRYEGPAAAARAEGPVAAPPILNSRPTAIPQLYLDFDGETVTDPDWDGGATIVAPATPLSNATITAIFNRVKEDFWAFNVNVTTDVAKYNAAPAGKRMRCIMTPNDAAAPGAGGVAYLDSFRDAGQPGGFSSTIPCWVFNREETGIAEAISHEFGHTFNLRHDGRSSPFEAYFRGHGSGATSWAPIMGVGYDLNVVQWSKGEYAFANNQEDDLLFISSRLGAAIGAGSSGYAADDVGGTRTSASGLNGNPTTGAISQTGNIERTGDVDFYTFVTNGGQATINAQGVTNGNLDIALELQEANGLPVAAGSNGNPGAQLNASLAANLAPGTYYLRVAPSGAGNPLTDGYSNYGSLGAYTVAGTITGLTLKPLITSSPTASGQVGVLFNYAIKATGSPTSFTATNLPAGLVLNATSGVISGFPQGAGTFTVALSATNAFGIGNGSVEISIVSANLTLAQAVDFESIEWTAGGDVPWVAQTGVAFDSTDAAQSGSIGNNQQSFLETTVLGPTTVKFRWKVSCEADSDFLAFQIDGVDQATISGETAWAEATHAVAAGAHTLRWVYRKNATLSDGLDSAWVDTVIFESTEAPVITSATSANGTVGNAFSYAIRGTNLPGVFAVTGTLPAGLKLNTATGVISGTPAVAGSANVAVFATNNIGSGQQPLAITIGPSPITVAQALDTTGIAWTLGGDASWFPETVETSDGVDALQAGPIGIGQQTFVQTTVTGVKTVNFRWKAECDTGAQLQFFIDGNLVTGASLSGFTEWQNPSILIPPGAHTIKWVFTKTAVTTLGADTVWLDRVVITTDLLPVISSSTTANGQQGLPFNYQIAASNSPTFFTAEGLPDGLLVNPLTGAITGVPEASGLFNATIGAGNQAGTGTAPVLIFIETAPTSLGEAFDQPSRGFATSGDELWVAQSKVTVDGADALESGPVGHSESSVLETGVTGPLVVRFRWKVSSESARDFLRFAIDGPLLAQISGEVDWQEKTFVVPPGTHTLRWTYQKDNSASAGQDKAWLDMLVLDTATTLPVFTSPLTTKAYLSREFRYQLAATNSPTSFGATGLPAGLTLNPNTGVISGTPEVEAISQVAITATNNSGTGNATLELSVEPEPPGADAFANATGLSGAVIRSQGTNLFATAEPGEPAHAGVAANGSIWWTWTAPLSGGVAITTVGSEIFTALSVYTGSSLGALTPVKENVGGGGGVASAVKFNAAGRETYYICVDGLGGARGKIVLNIGYTATGKYSGLLLDRNGVAAPGLITLSLSNKLTFTGVIALNGKKYPFKGAFAGEEFVGGVSRGKGREPLAIRLKLSLAAGAQEVSGGVEGDGLTYDLLANLPMGKAEVPPSLPGAFTFIIQPDATGGTNPRGLGYGSAKIDASGRVKAVGSLGDGTKFSTTTSVALDKSWLLFLTPYRGGGVVAARIKVEAGALFSPLSGVLNWRKSLDVKAKMFADGFGTTATLRGYRHSPTETASRILVTPLPAQNLQVDFTGGDLPAEPADVAVTLGDRNVVTDMPPGFKLKFTTATGVFAGSVPDPATGKERSFGGAVLNGTDSVFDDEGNVTQRTISRGGGLFFGLEQTGAIELNPVPAPE